MRRNIIITLVTALLMASLPTSSSAQQYDKLLGALSNLETTLRTILATQAAVPRAYPTIADADGEVVSAPIPTIDEQNWLMAQQLGEVVGELKTFVEQSRDAEKQRPKNPAATSHGKIALYGAVHGAYYQKTGSQRVSNFEMRTVQLGAIGSINDWANYQFIGEFAKSPSLLDAKLTLNASKQVSLEVGQYKPPFCTDNLRSTTVMPFVTASIAKSLGPSRDMGASVAYQHTLKTATVKLIAGLYNGATANTSDLNRDKNIMSRVEAKVGKTLSFAGNMIAGKTNAVDSVKQNLDSWGGSATWSWQRSVVEGEFIQSQVGTVDKAGWYLWAGQTFVTGSRFVPEIQLLARMEQLDGNLDVEGDRINRFVIGTNLLIDGKYTKLQINYMLNEEETNSVDNNELVFNLQVAF